jgi:hypothetical protein
MGATTRAAALNGQQWIGGIYPPGDARLHWAARQISDLHDRYSVAWYGEVTPALGLTDGADVETWQATIGTSPTQPTISKRPEYSSAWPSIAFDDVGEALTVPLDLSASGAVCAFVVADRAAGMSAAFRVLLEHGRFYAGATGFSIFAHPTNERIYVGIGTAGAYQDAYWDGYGSGLHVYAFTADASAGAGAQIRGWIDGVEIAPTATSGTGMNGSFGNDSIYIGARSDGSGGLERPMNGNVRAGLALASIPTDEEIALVSHALAVRAGVST